jgi:hypothetical protein
VRILDTVMPCKDGTRKVFWRCTRCNTTGFRTIKMTTYVVTVREETAVKTYTLVAESYVEAYIRATNSFADPMTNTKLISVKETNQRPTKDTL